MSINEVIEIDQSESNDENENAAKQTSRRGFIGKVGGFGLAAAVLGTTTSPKEIFAQREILSKGPIPPLTNPVYFRRARESLNIRRVRVKSCGNENSHSCF